MNKKSDAEKSKRYLVFTAGDKYGEFLSELIPFDFPGDNGETIPQGLTLKGIIYDHPHRVYGDKPYLGHLVGKPISGNPEISDLVGEILGIADALFIDNTQRKAFKDLLKNKIYSYANRQEDKLVTLYANHLEATKK